MDGWKATDKEVIKRFNPSKLWRSIYEIIEVKKPKTGIVREIRCRVKARPKEEFTIPVLF